MRQTSMNCPNEKEKKSIDLFILKVLSRSRHYIKKKQPICFSFYSKHVLDRWVLALLLNMC